MFEKLNTKDFRLMGICFVISIISLFFVQNYFTKVFPDASINMLYTKDEAHVKAKMFLANRGKDIGDFMHAHRFGYLYEAKSFLEFELPADEAGKILNNTNSYFWKNRWFMPQNKEEYYVKISTTGNLAEYEHKIDEEASGDSLSQEKALNIAEFFLAGTMDVQMEKWELVKSETEKLPNRWDHVFEWKEKSFDVHGGSHRITVKVQGNEVDFYDEWIKVPDTWKRKYAKVRSKNDFLNMFGGIGLNLTMFLIFIMMLVRSRKNDIRWKTAFTYGGVVAGLFILIALNNLPLHMYWFDNKDSYSSFFMNLILFRCILAPIGLGLFVGMLIAGSEPLYRDQYPHHISFRNIFSYQGIQSKSFYNSAMIGITLTFATFAFQTIYYLISNNLGAWSPRQVPNFDSYATYIPWVAVLIGGLLPAIMEESMSRMFSISFLQKYTKSTIFAVIFSSIIWGLAHANYPAQPFYIRAIEVSAMGIFISWIFIRYGILATLIWHFSVNAVYSAMILLRSSNAYFITTGAVCAGIILLPLIYAIMSYKRNGGFVSSDQLVNALDTEIMEEKPETKEAMKKTTIPMSYNPLGNMRVKIGIAIGIIGILSFYFVSTSIKSNDSIFNFSKMDKNRNETIKIARDYLESRGFNLDGYKSIAYSENWMSRGGPVGGHDKKVDYIMEFGGKEKLRHFFSKDYLAAMGWSVRFFIPEQKKEYKVYMLAKYDKPWYPHFYETLSDTASLPFLSKSEALTLVKEFANNTEIDLSNMDLIKEEVNEKENRTDYLFQFEGNESHDASIGDAKQFFKFNVHGNYIGSISAGHELPEAWEREWRKQTLYDNFHMFSLFSIIILIIVLGIRYLLQLIKNNEPNWKLALYFSGFFYIIQFIDSINSATFLQNYNTAKPFNLYLFEGVAEYLLGGFVSCIFIGVLVLAIHMSWPNFFKSFNKENRKIYMKDALVSFACSIGLFSILSSMNTLLTAYHSSYIGRNTFAVPQINQHLPFINVMNNVIDSTLPVMLMLVGVIYIYNRLSKNKKIPKTLILLMLSLPFILPGEGPILIYFIMNVIWFGIILLLIRYYWRFNPLSFLLGAFTMEALPDILNLISKIQDPTYRNQIFMAIFCITIFFLYFIKDLFSKTEIVNE